mmetsp:Transcript_48961/g.126257  ORF Transcript_48961/g.126257 Transcript_48961/m.126257 type:complete len:451 (-) Transcript_48961:130-1482(-)
MKRHQGNFAPEVTSAVHDLESPNGTKVYGGGKMIGLDGTLPHIQPFTPQGGTSADPSKSRRGRSPIDGEGAKQVAMVVGGVWLLGVLLMGYDWMWPVSMAFEVLYWILNTPPFSWIFGWIVTPMQWIFGWMYKGAPLVDQTQPMQELRLASDQVSTYLDTYVHNYGDAALIFASHDGYPQIVNGLLANRELGYKDLVDATDEAGNTALIYSSSKGYKQTTAALLRNGADPDVANQGGGGRTPLMEAAGGGHKDIVAAIRLSNATIDQIDDFQNTALHYAAYHGHLSVVQELLKSNPRRDIKNSYGHTAASYAAANKHKSIADLLNREPTKREKERSARMQEQELTKGKTTEDSKMKDWAKEMGLGDMFGDKKDAKKTKVKAVAADEEEEEEEESEEEEEEEEDEEEVDDEGEDSAEEQVAAGKKAGGVISPSSAGSSSVAVSAVSALPKK